MTALNKKRKCRNTLYDRGGEKGKYQKDKGFIMFHKKDRVILNAEANKGE